MDNLTDYYVQGKIAYPPGVEYTIRKEGAKPLPFRENGMIVRYFIDFPNRQITWEFEREIGENAVETYRTAPQDLDNIETAYALQVSTFNTQVQEAARKRYDHPVP